MNQYDSRLYNEVEDLPSGQRKFADESMNEGFLWNISTPLYHERISMFPAIRDLPCRLSLEIWENDLCKLLSQKNYN